MLKPTRTRAGHAQMPRPIRGWPRRLGAKEVPTPLGIGHPANQGHPQARPAQGRELCGSRQDPPLPSLAGAGPGAHRAGVTG